MTSEPLCVDRRIINYWNNQELETEDDYCGRGEGGWTIEINELSCPKELNLFFITRIDI